ncbi:MAG: ribonuclease HI family protein [Candidatus Peregrinibacteria bacterium]
MIRLPAALERRLAEMIPRVRERERFVTEVLEKELRTARPVMIDQPASIGGTLHLFSDGGSRGNPGQSAIGCVLVDPSTGKVVQEHCERIGIQTNNVAEYRALIEGLKLARHHQPSRLLCHLDSELIVRQLNGQYRVKMPTLIPFFEEIRILAKTFPVIQFIHVPRASNAHADALVNKALDEHPSPHFTPVRNVKLRM